MKWHFQYRRKELFGAIVRMHRGMICLLGIPCVLSLLLYVFMQTGQGQGRRFPAEYLIGSMMIAALTGLWIWERYRWFLREVEDMEKELRMEEKGMVLASKRGRSWFFYDEISRILPRGSCLWVVMENKLILLVPRRIFSNREEQEQFIRMLNTAKASAGETSADDKAAWLQNEQKTLMETYQRFVPKADRRIFCGWNDAGMKMAAEQAKACGLRLTKVPRKDAETGERMCWEILFGEETIFLREILNLSVYRWDELQYLAETPEYFFLCNAAKKICLYFRKSAVGGKEKQEQFRHDCEARGLKFILRSPGSPGNQIL